MKTKIIAALLVLLSANAMAQSSEPGRVGVGTQTANSQVAATRTQLVSLMIDGTRVTGYLMSRTGEATMFVGSGAGAKTPKTWRLTAAQAKAATPATGLAYFGDAVAPSEAVFSYGTLTTTDGAPVPGYRLTLTSGIWFVPAVIGVVTQLATAAQQGEFVAAG